MASRSEDSRSPRPLWRRRWAGSFVLCERLARGLSWPAVVAGGVAVLPATSPGPVLIALISPFADRLLGPVHPAASRIRHADIDCVRSIQSGMVGDFLTWLTLGMAAIGLFLAIRMGLATPRSRAGRKSG